ncbi:membrane protein insertase YidC [bacterium]|nr:membrane protein insertase YidC [bacterium]
MSPYHDYIFVPLYNGLIYLIDVFPWMDAGIAVIVFTIIVKLILFPISKKAIRTQVGMKEIEPELARLRATYKDDKQVQTLKTMELYKEKGINPFSSFFLLFIQLPILYALYSVFMRSGLPVVNASLLYSFVKIPTISMHFLGLFDISKPNIFFALLAALSQFLQLHYSLASKAPSSPASSGDAAVEVAQNMTKQMKYIFPVMVFFISFKLSAVISVYWIVSNLFTLGQELYVRSRLAVKA